MDKLTNHLLSSAAFSNQQDGNAGRRDFRNYALKRKHRWALPSHKASVVIYCYRVNRLGHIALRP